MQHLPKHHNDGVAMVVRRTISRYLLGEEPKNVRLTTIAKHHKHTNLFTQKSLWSILSQLPMAKVVRVFVAI